jgi:phospholipid/cholesterol/gamma-HCH transport system substrate-binding protein
MKKFFSKEVLIGVTVLISLALLFGGIKFLKGVNIFKPANFYYVKYEQVKDLTVSAPVTINGYQVGLVREISYDYENNGHIVAQLSLDRELKVPEGTQAVIVSDMLGTSHIALKLSSSRNYYNVGDEIPGVIQSGLMDNVTKQVMPQVAEMMPKVDSILTNLNKILSNPALNASVGRLDNITANLEKSTIELNIIMARSVPGVMNNANDVSKDLKHISKNLSAMSDELRKLPIDSTMRNMNATVGNLKHLTDKLNNKNSSLGLLLNDKRLYNHADRSVVSLDSLLRDLRLHPKRYLTIKVF